MSVSGRSSVSVSGVFSTWVGVIRYQRGSTVSVSGLVTEYHIRVRVIGS